VVHTKTGKVYERRLLEEHIEGGGRCPETDEPFAEEDIVAITADKAVRPRPVTSSSIPGMLQTFQNEWDSLMLETADLKRALHNTREELSQALYMHDAACRVIARMVRERDQARAALAAMQSQAGSGAVASGAGGAAAEDVSMDGGGAAAGTPKDAALQAVATKMQSLSAARMQRKVAEDLTPREAVSGFTEVDSHNLHSSRAHAVNAVAVCPANGNLVLTGGNDKTAKVFDKSEGKVVGSLGGHKKRVTQVGWHSESTLAVTASEDAVVKVWAQEGDDWGEKATLAPHAGGLTGLAVHPTGAHLLTSAGDELAFSDVATASVLFTMKADDVGAMTACAFHPDGALLGAGTEGKGIPIFDLRAGAVAAVLAGAEGTVTSVAFSENGRHTASTGSDGIVRVYDLRKTKQVQAFELGSSGNAVSFDHSGRYLAAAGEASVRVWGTKPWEQLADLSAHKKSVTGVSWGPKASFLASVSADRALKFYATA
jgi:pre-mRNA-processing factor 19